MPERWERNLRKLDALKPPADLSDRIGEPGPVRPIRHPDTAGRLRHAVTVAVAFAVFLPAAYVAWVAFRPAAEPPQPAAAPEPSELPNVAQVTCSNEGETSTSTPRIQVQDDGIHFEVDDRWDAGLLSIEGRSGLAWTAGQTVGIGEDGRVHSSFMPPGDIVVACFTRRISKHLGGFLAEHRTAEVRVEDPLGLYVPFALQCRGSGHHRSGVTMTEEELEHPEESIRATLSGLLPEDEIDRVGYPEPDPPKEMMRLWYRIGRDGRTVGTVRLHEPTGGGHIEVCRDSDIDGEYSMDE